MKTETPEQLLAEIAADPKADVTAALARLADWVRPGSAARAEDAIRRIEALCALLRERRDQRDLLRERLSAWLERMHHVPLLAEAGVLSTRGFVREIAARCYERVLPAPPVPDDLHDAFCAIFRAPRDARWMPGVPLGAWMGLVEAIELDAAPGSALFERLRRGVMDAAEVLALRIAAEGTESELLRLDPDAERHDSPFLVLQREVAAVLARLEANRADRAVPAGTLEAAEAAIASCAQAIERLRAVGRTRGTTVRVTYLLERIAQQLARLGLVLRALDPADAGARRRAAFELFLAVAGACATRLSVADVWQANTRLLAKRVTENASRAGEHYATRDRGEYLGMLRAALGAGVLVALMALLKVEIKAAHLPPLIEALAVCADYATGFVVIHVLHLTVATKQPAMTAATLAATLEEAQGRRDAAALGPFVALVASVARTQLVAILGNLGAALPVALVLAWTFARLAGEPLVGAQKSAALVAELDPVAGLAMLHAAIAGVWLFVAGLVSGWYDNRCAVLEIPARVRASPVLAWMPARWREGLAAYVDGNLGALMGNAIFGFLLGGTAFAGFLLGLPIDIRHVAFASANLGYASVTLDLSLKVFAMGLGCVLLIAAVNLAVSFSLALAIALRSRGVTLARVPGIAAALLGHLARHPRDFVLPPREAAR